MIDDLVYWPFINMVIVSTAYGSFLLGSYIAFRSSGSSNRPKTILLLCLVVIFLSFTWNVVNILGYSLLLSRVALASILAKYLREFSQTIYNQSPWVYMQSWPVAINLLLSDFIVTWRAWVLLQNARFWRFALVSLMVACIGINVMDSIVQVLISTPDFISKLDPKDGLRLSDSSLPLDLFSIVTSLMLNVCATLLVVWKAWGHHCLLTEAGFRKQTYLQRILLLLIESGAIFCATQLTYIIYALKEKDLVAVDFENLVYAFPVSLLLTFSTAWYPVAVIILIHTQSSPVVETLSTQSGIIAQEESPNARNSTVLFVSQSIG